MDSTILAIRAITAYYGRTLLWPVLGVGLAVYAGLFALSWFLAAEISPWWWLLVIMLTPLSLVLLALWILGFIVIRRIHPSLDKRQKQLVREISSHAASIAAQLGTPKAIILSQIVRDAVFMKDPKNSYIGELTREPGEARRKFDELRDSL